MGSLRFGGFVVRVVAGKGRKVEAHRKPARLAGAVEKLRAVRFGNGLYDDETESQAVDACRGEGRAEVRHLFFGKKTSVVFDREADLLGGPQESHAHGCRRSGFFRRALGVLEKVEEKKEEFESVSLHHGFLFGEFERHGRAA